MEPVVTRRASTLRRKWLTLRRKAREIQMVAYGLAHKDHPIWST